MKQKSPGYLSIRVTAWLIAITFSIFNPSGTLMAEENITASKKSTDTNKYVICETYAWSRPGSNTSMNVSWYAGVKTSNGRSWPSRWLDEDYRLSKDPRAFARHQIRLAKEAGIDAFMFGDTSYGDHTQFTDIFWAYWNAAKEDETFKLMPNSSVLHKESWHGTANNVRWEKFRNSWSRLAKEYTNAWLKIDGKYTLYNWNRDPLHNTSFASAEELEQVFAPLGGLDHIFLLNLTSYLFYLTPVGEGGVNPEVYKDPNVLKTKEYFRKYASALTHFQMQSYGDLPENVDALENVAHELNKEVVYPVMNAFYQQRGQFITSTWPGGRVREKLGFAGCYYQWKRAIESGARIVYLLTWNDLSEDHSVMPEKLHGWAYYELTKYFCKWFKTGKKPEVEKEQILLFHHPQLTEVPMNFPESSYPAGRWKNSKTPPTDYIGVVVMLTNSAKVTVEMGISEASLPKREIASRDFPAGVNFWLIYHPLTSSNESAIPVIDPEQNNISITGDIKPVYPEQTDDFFVTKLPQGLTDGEVFVSVERDDKNAGYFISQMPIADTAAYGNLGTVGNVFVLEQNK